MWPTSATLPSNGTFALHQRFFLFPPSSIHISKTSKKHAQHVWLVPADDDDWPIDPLVICFFKHRFNAILPSACQEF
jgi:hypothetical protein